MKRTKSARISVVRPSPLISVFYGHEGPVTKPRAWLLIAVVGAMGMGIHWGREFVRVDSCLDAGYVYGYATDECDTQELTLPVIPYGDRHPWMLRVGGGFVLFCLVGAAIASVRYRAGQATTG